MSPFRLLPVLLLLGACAAQSHTPEFDGDAALAYARTQVEFGPRVPGTEGHRRMAAWLDGLLRERADTVLVQAWEHTTADGDVLPMQNFLARFNPGAPDRVLFLAHWDTRPVADASGVDGEPVPVPGANDGASGVAVLLGMADALRARPPAIGVDLLFVDGEDYGSFSADRDVLIGSRYYARNLPPGPRPRYAVLFDMVGSASVRLYQESHSLTGAPDIVELVWRTARDLGYQDVFIPEPRHTVTDDHLPLLEVGIKAIDVIDMDYPYWHTPDDTVDKLSAETLRKVGDVGMALVRRER